MILPSMDWKVLVRARFLSLQSFGGEDGGPYLVAMGLVNDSCPKHRVEPVAGMPSELSSWFSKCLGGVVGRDDFCVDIVL